MVRVHPSDQGEHAAAPTPARLGRLPDWGGGGRRRRRRRPNPEKRQARDRKDVEFWRV